MSASKNKEPVQTYIMYTLFDNGQQQNTAAGSGYHVGHRVKKPVMRLRVDSLAEAAAQCLAPLAWLASAASPMFVERFTTQSTFCMSWVLVFLKPCLTLVKVKPDIIKSAFSWHCANLNLIKVSLLYKVQFKSDVTPRREQRKDT